MADSELKVQGPSGQKRVTNPDGDGYAVDAEAVAFDNAGTPLAASDVQAGLAEASAGIITSVGDGLDFTANELTLDAILAALAALGTTSTRGQFPIYSGSAWQYVGILTGTNLTDADQTLLVADGSRRVLPGASTLTTTRTKTLSATATSGDVLVIERYDTTANTMTVVDAASAATLYTFPVSVKRSASFKFDGTNWAFQGSLLLAGG